MYSVDNPIDDKISAIQTAVVGDLVSFGHAGTIADSGIPQTAVLQKSFAKLQTPALGQTLAVAAPYTPLLLVTVYNNSINGNLITNNSLTGIVTITTGPAATNWRLYFSANILSPLNTEASFQMFNQTTLAFFDTQTFLTAPGVAVLISGNGIIENFISLPPNSVFKFSVDAQTPSLIPAIVGNTFQPAYLNIQQI